MKKYSTPAYIDGEHGETVFGSVDVYLASEVDARIAELEKLLDEVYEYGETSALHHRIGKALSKLD